MRSTASDPNTVREAIGGQLRAMYDKVLREPLPKRFSELLNSLETGTILPMPRPQKNGTASPHSEERKRRVG